MFNLLVSGGGWEQHEGSVTADRVFEHTDQNLIDSHRHPGGIDYAKLRQYPCLFMPELNGDENALANVGWLHNINPGRNVSLRYAFDRDFPPITLGMIKSVQHLLQMSDFEFHRTHWALKNVDLFQVMMKAMKPVYNKPTIFQVNDPPSIDATQISVMMSFDAAFGPVYASMQRMGASLSLKVNRADDIWIHHQIIQDVVTLIDRSAVVVADLTNRNSNVFYEVGIAHALGREVILITQSMEFVPFDLRHLRVVQYHNNEQGIAQLEATVRERVKTLLTLPAWM